MHNQQKKRKKNAFCLRCLDDKNKNNITYYTNMNSIVYGKGGHASVTVEAGNKLRHAQPSSPRSRSRSPRSRSRESIQELNRKHYDAMKSFDLKIDFIDRSFPREIVETVQIAGQEKTIKVEIKRKFNDIADLKIDADAFILHSSNEPIFTIVLLLNIGPPDFVFLELFKNNLFGDPAKFQNTKLDFTAQDLSGIGRKLVCRLLRELINVGLSSNVIIRANLSPTVKYGTQGTKEELQRLLKMYETYSFRISNPEEEIEIGAEIESTLGQVVRACDLDRRSSRGTPFNRQPSADDDITNEFEKHFMRLQDLGLLHKN